MVNHINYGNTTKYIYICSRIRNFSTMRIISLVFLCISMFCSGSNLDEQFRRYGLVDISTLDPTIAVELKYATTDNFMRRNMYGTLRRAYFQPDIAKRICKAQALLKAKNPNYSLIIYDAARPVSIQKIMFAKVKGTSRQKYVASPHRGGPHNYGIAVDVGLLFNGRVVDMGTTFDSFSPMSHITNERYYLKNKKLSPQAYNARQLLRGVMRSVGFSTIRKEWWHFDGYTKQYTRKHYKLLNF